LRRPLRRQILLPFAGLVTLAVGVVSAVDAWRAAQAVDRGIERHMADAADVLLHAGFPLTDAVLRQTARLSGAEFVCTDAAGDVRAASFAEVAALGDVFRVAPRDEATSGPTHPDVVRTDDGVEYLHRLVERPSRGAGDDALRLHMFYPQQVRAQLMRQAIWPPLAVGGVALVVATALSYWLAGRISGPLAALQKHFTRLGGGDYAALPVPSRDDEIRELVESANVLAAQLEDRTRAVERASRSAALGRLSGGLCHHLRNAAAGAKLALQLHVRRCASGDTESIDVARRQLDLIAQYLQQLLTLGKPQAARRRPADAQTIVADAVALVAPTLAHRGIELRRRIAEAPAPMASVDTDQLRQAVVNLLLNAVEASVEGGWAEISLVLVDDGVRIAVADGGPGPPAEIAERLFEPFVTGKPDGVGLGLAAARRIVEDHGGTLTFRAKPHTTFEIALPAGDVLPQGTPIAIDSPAIHSPPAAPFPPEGVAERAATAVPR
jgi:signal transduction histidine kinase